MWKLPFCIRGEERRNDGLNDLRVGDLGELPDLEGSPDLRRFNGDRVGANSSGMVGGGTGISVRS